MTKKDKQRRKQKLAQAHREGDELESFKKVQDFLKEKGMSKEDKKEVDRLKMKKTLAEYLKKSSGNNSKNPKKTNDDIHGNLEQPSDSDEDDYYKQIQSERQGKKDRVSKRKQEEIDEMFEGDEEGNEENLRTINYKIMKNKGLIRKRKKEDRNSRVKLKTKYEKAIIKQRVSSPLTRTIY